MAQAVAAVVRALPRTVTAGPRAAVRDLRLRYAIDEATAVYRAWVARQTPAARDLAKMAADAAALAWQPLISVITPVYNTDPAALHACIDSVRAQVYPNWELCLCDDGSTIEAIRAVLREQADPRIRPRFLANNAGISAASNAALEMARGEFVALLDHDDELTPDALYRVAVHLNSGRDADVVYSDEDKRDEDGGLSEPFFKPDWSPEHLLSAMYTCHLTVARRSIVERAGGFRVGYEGAQDHDLMLRIRELTDRIDHLPRVLYHWRRTPQSTASAGAAKPWADDAGRRALEDYVRRNRLDAEVISGGVPGLYRVKFAIRDRRQVTIVVTAANGDVASAHACATALRGCTAYAPHEILIVVADASSLGARVNAAVRSRAGSHVVMLDSALRPAHEGWLEAMLEYSQQQPIGAVGARIEYADGRLRHIGMVTATDGGPARVFHGHAAATYGHFSSAIGVRNYAAVSGECLMTRREVFDQAGGFDESMPWGCADVDYCVRIRRTGARVVFTPYARLKRPAAWLPAGVDAEAAAALRSRWGAALDDDPYYNPNLSRRSADYLLNG
jgi:GT2 family glycosyltransferase